MIVRNEKTLLLIHSTPWNSNGEYVCAQQTEFRRFGDMPVDIVLCGHTHQPTVQQVGAVLVVNPGSVGQRSWYGEQPVFSFALLDPASTRARIVAFAT
jgi:predicted phosphodiesterase